MAGITLYVYTNDGSKQITSILSSSTCAELTAEVKKKGYDVVGYTKTINSIIIEGKADSTGKLDSVVFSNVSGESLYIIERQYETWKQLVHDCADAYRKAAGVTDKVPVGELAGKISMILDSSIYVWAKYENSFIISQSRGTFPAGVFHMGGNLVDQHKCRLWKKIYLAGDGKLVTKESEGWSLAVLTDLKYGDAVTNDDYKYTISNDGSGTIYTDVKFVGDWEGDPTLGLYSLSGRSLSRDVGLNHIGFVVSVLEDKYPAEGWGEDEYYYVKLK